MTFPYDAQMDLSHEPLIEFMFFVAFAGGLAILALVGIAVAKTIELARIRRDARQIARDAAMYGVSFQKDGKRIPPERIYK